eukprot:4510741-Amphidinium_carterae.1
MHHAHWLHRRAHANVDRLNQGCDLPEPGSSSSNGFSSERAAPYTTVVSNSKHCLTTHPIDPPVSRERNEHINSELN